MQTFYKAVVAMVLALCPVWAISQNINHVATHFTKLFDEAAAEIVVHDKDNDRLIFTNANANSMTLLNFSD
ncbi:MAG: hypothetical protein KDC92_02635, partial [Bacteroidetes bacterium]|nr:hypothetical protein [Bacteroidota bacterium]